MTAVTFDFGQTLAELDTGFLAQRAGERGASVTRERLDAASPAAWGVYDEAKRSGWTGKAAWSAFMSALLEKAGTVTGSSSLESIVEFLWNEQPTRNLWRRPIPGMLELVTELSARSVPLAIISNSEGRLAELVSEIGLGQAFPVVADSGVLGFEKPDPRIFEWTAERLGVPTRDLVHVGDVWVADVEGALGVGARAIWVTADSRGVTLPGAVTACSGAAEIRATLAAFHLL
jgi:HAD superfamily hydrolase (TIGR01509 family)